MLGGKTLKMTGMIVLVLFSFFTLSADLAWAGQQEDEDILLQARSLYQEGDYEGSIQLLGNFIAKLKAIVAQKKNVAEAFYLLAKVYYTVGEDQKVNENLRKVFETYPAFERREVDLEFQQRVARVRAQVQADAVTPEKTPQETEVSVEPEPASPPADNGVIMVPAKKKKKKKFPILLVVGGLAAVVLLAVLLGGGSKSDEKIRLGNVTWAKVKVTIVYAGENLTTNHKSFINNELKLFKNVRFNQDYNPDHEYEDFQRITEEFFFEGGLGSYEIRHEVGPDWAKLHPLQDNYWIGATRYKLDVVEYEYENGADPGPPVLSADDILFRVNPSDTDPTSEWYRIETQTMRIQAPGSPASTTSSPMSGANQNKRGIAR